MKFTGGYKLDGGPYHFGARYYDLATGTWTQPDPINQIADLVQANRYSYAGGDVVNNVDLSGLILGISVRDATEVVVGAATAVGGAALTVGAVVGAGACIAATRGLEAPECIGLGLKVGAVGASGVITGVLVARQGIQGRS